MSASASGEGDRAGYWDWEEGMLPLPLEKEGLIASRYNADDVTVCWFLHVVLTLHEQC